MSDNVKTNIYDLRATGGSRTRDLFLTKESLCL